MSVSSLLPSEDFLAPESPYWVEILQHLDPQAFALFAEYLSSSLEEGWPEIAKLSSLEETTTLSLSSPLGRELQDLLRQYAQTFSCPVHWWSPSLFAQKYQAGEVSFSDKEIRGILQVGHPLLLEELRRRGLLSCQDFLGEVFALGFYNWTPFLREGAIVLPPEITQHSWGRRLLRDLFSEDSLLPEEMVEFLVSEIGVAELGEVLHSEE